eukprot:scaffold1939_cov392-Prasinococcus_capsulatus_cf.AAC.10
MHPRGGATPDAAYPASRPWPTHRAGRARHPIPAALLVAHSAHSLPCAEGGRGGWLSMAAV